MKNLGTLDILYVAYLSFLLGGAGLISDHVHCVHICCSHFQGGDDDPEDGEEEKGEEVDPAEGGQGQLLPRGPHQRADLRAPAQPPHQGPARPLGREDLEHRHLSGNQTEVYRARVRVKYISEDS